MRPPTSERCSSAAELRQPHRGKRSRLPRYTGSPAFVACRRVERNEVAARSDAPLPHNAVSERPRSTFLAPEVTLGGSAGAESRDDQDLPNSQVTAPALGVATLSRARSTEAMSKFTAHPVDYFTLTRTCDNSTPDNGKNGSVPCLSLQDRVAMRMARMAHEDLEQVTASDDDMDLRGFTLHYVTSSEGRENGGSVSKYSLSGPDRPCNPLPASALAPVQEIGTLGKGETIDRGSPGALVQGAGRDVQGHSDLADWASQQAYHESKRRAMEERRRLSETTAMEAVGASRVHKGIPGAQPVATLFKASKGVEMIDDDEGVLHDEQGLRSRKTSSAYSSSPPAGPTTPCRRAAARLRACSSSVTEGGSPKASPARPWTLGGKPWSPSYNGLAVRNYGEDLMDVGTAPQSTRPLAALEYMAQLSLNSGMEQTVSDNATPAGEGERQDIECDHAIGTTSNANPPTCKSFAASTNPSFRNDSEDCSLEHVEEDAQPSPGSEQYEASDPEPVGSVKRATTKDRSVLTRKDGFQEPTNIENDSIESLAEVVSSCEAAEEHVDRAKNSGTDEFSTEGDFVGTVLMLVLVSVAWILASAKNA